MSIALFSGDSSYGGISFIANHIPNSTVFLTSSIRKDFDNMINNKIYIKEKNKFFGELEKKDEIIIFSAYSLIKFLKNVGVEQLNHFKRKTIILSDTTYKTQSKKWNGFMVKNNFKILSMPDLCRFLGDIEHKPYWQHINIDNKLIERKNDVITITHSPTSRKRNSDSKGTKKIKTALNDYNLEIISGDNWNICVRKKSKSHIFIDQMNGGGLGKSGLEGMLLGCLTITSGNLAKTEPYFPTAPVVICNIDNLKETIDYYINNPEEYNKKVKEQKEWADKYLSAEFVVKNILE